MTLQHPYLLLLLAAAPILWKLLRPVASRSALIWKAIIFALLVLALADPSLPLSTRRLSVAVLIDTSLSMPRQSLEQARAVLAQVAGKKLATDLKLITFDERARVRPLPSSRQPLGADDTAATSEATDIAGAMHLALGRLPERGARRALLISDGNENRGSALDEAIRARQAGVQVFTLPLGGTAKLPVAVESIALPQHVLSGERFTVALRLQSGRALPAHISLTADGREIGASSVNLVEGANSVEVEGRIESDGIKLLEGDVESGGAHVTLFSRATTVRKPRLLFVGNSDAPSKALLDTLRKAQLEVQTVPSLPQDPSGVDNWDALLLDNFPDHPLTLAENNLLERYVAHGGGLIFVGGDKNSSIPEKPQTPFDRMLPVRGDPEPPPKEITAVMLVIDRSASMEGQKIAMAREAASSSLDLLRPTDKVGLIAFDARFNWIVPLQRATDLQSIRDLIHTITPDGGTNMYPPLEAAVEALQNEKATHKHLIVLTDGLSEPGQFLALAQRATNQHVTISTVGIGGYVDRKLLTEIASTAGGKSYFVEDPQHISQIVTDEVRSAVGTPIQEKDVRAEQVRQIEFTDGVDFKSAPPLLGYVKAKAKPGSETILRLSSGSPLLVRWQYGLGRVVTFLADGSARWSAPWVQWPGFNRLWPQMVRDVCQPDRNVRAGVRATGRTNEVAVYYDFVGDENDSTEASARRSMQVRISPPGQASRLVTLEETAPGHFETRLPVESDGIYRIAPVLATSTLPEVGYYRAAEEQQPKDINVGLLTEVSRVSGGSVRPALNELLSDQGAYTREPRPMWPYLLMLALVVNFAELAIRKGLFERRTA